MGGLTGSANERYLYFQSLTIAIVCSITTVDVRNNRQHSSPASLKKKLVIKM